MRYCTQTDSSQRDIAPPSQCPQALGKKKKNHLRWPLPMAQKQLTLDIINNYNTDGLPPTRPSIDNQRVAHLVALAS